MQWNVVDYFDLLSDGELFAESGDGSAKANANTMLVPCSAVGDLENPSNPGTNSIEAQLGVVKPEHAL